MKILHLLQSQRFSGAENVACQIIEMFRDDAGFEMAYCSRDGQIRETLNERDIAFYPIKEMSVSEVKRVVKEYNPDIIHAHDITASVLAVLVAFGRKCKVISHVHVNNSNMARINKKTLLYEIITHWFSYIFWVSRSCYDSYVFRKRVEKKSEVLSNVMDKESIINRCNADSHEYRYDVVFIGRITEQKDPDRLIDVVKKLAEKLPGVKVAIAGTGDLEEHTKKLVENYNLISIVDFLGFMSNPLKLLFDAKVMLMTSKFEGLPMTVLEAMALGTPVVSTPVDGLKEVISNGINGYLESENSQLVQKMIDIIKNTELRSQLSQNCIRKFDEMNNLAEYKDRLHKVYTGG